MKILLLFTILMTGCTTVYKVDDKNVCRDPKGKVVNVKDVDPDRLVKNLGGLGYNNSIYGYFTRLMQLNNGGTAYGW